MCWGYHYHYDHHLDMTLDVAGVLRNDTNKQETYSSFQHDFVSALSPHLIMYIGRDHLFYLSPPTPRSRPVHPVYPVLYGAVQQSVTHLFYLSSPPPVPVDGMLSQAGPPCVPCAVSSYRRGGGGVLRHSRKPNIAAGRG